jgi:hypothetical protein
MPLVSQTTLDEFYAALKSADTFSSFDPTQPAELQIVESLPIPGEIRTAFDDARSFFDIQFVQNTREIVIGLSDSNLLIWRLPTNAVTVHQIKELESSMLISGFTATAHEGGKVTMLVFVNDPVLITVSFPLMEFHFSRSEMTTKVVKLPGKNFAVKSGCVTRQGNIYAVMNQTVYEVRRSVRTNWITRALLGEETFHFSALQFSSWLSWIFKSTRMEGTQFGMKFAGNTVLWVISECEVISVDLLKNQIKGYSKIKQVLAGFNTVNRNLWVETEPGNLMVKISPDMKKMATVKMVNRFYGVIDEDTAVTSEYNADQGKCSLNLRPIVGDALGGAVGAASRGSAVFLGKLKEIGEFDGSDFMILTSKSVSLVKVLAVRTGTDVERVSQVLKCFIDQTLQVVGNDTIDSSLKLLRRIEADSDETEVFIRMVCETLEICKIWKSVGYCLDEIFGEIFAQETVETNLRVVDLMNLFLSKYEINVEEIAKKCPLLFSQARHFTGPFPSGAPSASARLAEALGARAPFEGDRAITELRNLLKDCTGDKHGEEKILCSFIDGAVAYLNTGSGNFVKVFIDFLVDRDFYDACKQFIDCLIETGHGNLLQYQQTVLEMISMSSHSKESHAKQLARLYSENSEPLKASAIYESLTIFPLLRITSRLEYASLALSEAKKAEDWKFLNASEIVASLAAKFHTLKYVQIPLLNELDFLLSTKRGKSFWVPKAVEARDLLMKEIVALPHLTALADDLLIPHIALIGVFLASYLPEPADFTERFAKCLVCPVGSPYSSVTHTKTSQDFENLMGFIFRRGCAKFILTGEAYSSVEILLETSFEDSLHGFLSELHSISVECNFSPRISENLDTLFELCFFAAVVGKAQTLLPILSRSLKLSENDLFHACTRMVKKHPEYTKKFPVIGVLNPKNDALLEFVAYDLCEYIQLKSADSLTTSITRTAACTALNALKLVAKDSVKIDIERVEKLVKKY